jgi:hypothetical protein
MSRAGRSLFLFSIYVIAAGILLVFIPNALFDVAGMPRSSEVWPRFAGVLAIVLGLYEMLVGRTSIPSLLRLSVYTRASFILFLAAFVLSGLAKPVLIVLGAIDLAGATWTFLALRAAPR